MKNPIVKNKFVLYFIISILLVGGLAPNVSNAAVDDKILVRGKVANAWTKEKVKITDHFNQTYYTNFI